FTVSPIRHLKDGAHGNLISKATLLLAEEEICGMFPGQCEYFPAYEIMMDELRDYRFYAEDMVHPSAQAVNYIWERFCDFALADSERPVLAEKEREFRRSQHVEGRRWSSL
ncbi:MAG: GSCFA domain-containing protein, partial [Bacteroidetes bacterium]|nr:GSCFA domain-containing protein [Candidatus Cryptobacteroides faecavium]